MQPTDKNQEVQQDTVLENEASGTPEAEPEAEMAALEAQLKAAEKQRDEYLDMAQRMKAEFENFKRRNQAVRSEAYEDGARETVTQILPVIDNLERALDSTDEKTPLCEGVELVYKQLMDTLKKRGVEVIDCQGKPFDPEVANAVMQVDSDEGEPGTVCSVMQKGYTMNGRVLRHAMVTVVAQ